MGKRFSDIAPAINPPAPADQVLALVGGTTDNLVSLTQLSKSSVLKNAIDIRDYGAVGNGTTDNTVAIQAAMDAAWGPLENPHGQNIGVGSCDLNRPLYIPNGTYLVSTPAPLTIANVAPAPGTGAMRITVNENMSAWKSGWIVYVENVVSSLAPGTDYFANAVNTPHGITIIDAHTFDCNLTSSGWNSGGTYASGGVVGTAALHNRAVCGGLVYGDGAQASIISCSNGSCWSVNGWGYCLVRDISIKCPLPIQAARAFVAFDLNWDDTALSVWAGANKDQSTQSNTFQNVNFAGGKYNMVHGWGGTMCSETLFLRCSFGSQAGSGNIAGLYIGNQNSVGISMIGGDIQSCANGIMAGAGAINLIHGVQFQGQFHRDINLESSQGDCVTVSGCRTESPFFIEAHAGMGLNVTGCNQLSSGTSDDGKNTFVWSESYGLTDTSQCNRTRIDSCFSTNGNLSGNGLYAISASNFGIGWATAIAGLIGSGQVISLDVGPFTFAHVPPASVSIKGLRLTITDGPASPVWGAVVSAGGGSTLVPIYCDGAAWRIG